MIFPLNAGSFSPKYFSASVTVIVIGLGVIFNVTGSAYTTASPFVALVYTVTGPSFTFVTFGAASDQFSPSVLYSMV